jgi:hypothetical protein
MNKGGNPKSLVASHPGNLNAAKHGVHSPRLIQERAAEIATELMQFELSPAERLAAHEAARCIAILEAIDRDLDQRGLVDNEGQPRYLLNHRSRTSRQLEHWLEKISTAIERQAPAADQAPPRADFPDYVRELQRIALGHDTTATARDRLTALNELLELGPKGTTSYLERPAQAELTERENAIREAAQRRSIVKRESELGIDE